MPSLARVTGRWGLKVICYQLKVGKRKVGKVGNS